METKIIGGKITEARKKISLSQAELAQRLFISPQAVGKWEHGESFPDILTFIRLAKILGVDLNYFSDDFPSMGTESDESGLKRSAEMKSGKQAESYREDALRRDMSGGNWLGADFSGLKNLQEKFSSSNMKTCRFVGSEMPGLLLKNNNIESCDFTDSDISNSQIQGSNLGKNIFINCSLKETEFSKSNIGECDFTNADFTQTKFKSSNFGKNTIVQAKWNHTSFIGMHIVDVVFDGTLEDCYFENSSFYRVTFRNARLLNNFFKNNKSLKKIKFIDCQTDRMTYEFLRIGKADLSGITLITT
jgi:uncharacterized protein YjbI with pentapeptide repeats/DNA-binding XRE family transcriptional regulator